MSLFCRPGAGDAPKSLAKLSMLYVGQASLVGDIARYAQNFNVVELLAEPGRLPKASGLRKWKTSAGNEFAFSLRVSARVWQADEDECNKLVSYVSEVAKILAPKVCLLQTPASATPTPRNRKRLAALCDRLRYDSAALAWEPRGVWEQSELLAQADDLGVLLVQDLSREFDPPPGSSVYTRLLALGGASHVRGAAAETVAEKVQDYESVYVIIEGTGARGAGKIIREAVGDLRI